jgi:hypothetical protein
MLGPGFGALEEARDSFSVETGVWKEGFFVETRVIEEGLSGFAVGRGGFSALISRA